MNSTLAIADAHLGLFSEDISCESEQLKDLLYWIKELESKENGIELFSKIEPLISRRIFPSDRLVLLGDIVELWDANDRSIYLCSTAIMHCINSLKSNVTYLVGNHDYLIGEHKGTYPLLSSRLDILPDTYPEQLDKSKIGTIQKGESEYLFLHGHQFDMKFRRLGPVAMTMAYLRDGAEALGAYSRIAFGFFLIFLGGWLIFKFTNIPTTFTIDFYFYKWFIDMAPIKNTFLWFMISMVMAIFALPKPLVSIARRIWMTKKTRYNRKRALDGFIDWWKHFSKNRYCNAKNLNIVYGHTHILDLMSIQRAQSIVSLLWKRRFLDKLDAIRSIDKMSINLINIPSWVHETKKDVIRNVILYIDDDGFEFLKWDPLEKRPYLIPKSTIQKMSYNEPLTKEEKSFVKA